MAVVEGCCWMALGNQRRLNSGWTAGVIRVALHDKECQISIEYKPNEPRAYSLLSNLSTTLLAIKEINLPNLGVTLDFAHILYADEQPAFAAATDARDPHNADTPIFVNLFIVSPS